MRFNLHMIAIRPAKSGDAAALWQILEPIIRDGEVFAWPRGMIRDDALALWTSPTAEVYVAELGGQVVGTAFLKANQDGGGAHVANGGYATAVGAQGKGIARAMCIHTSTEPGNLGFGRCNSTLL